MFKKMVSVFLAILTLSGLITTGVLAMNIEEINNVAAAQQMILDDLGKSYLKKDVIDTVAYDQKLLEEAYLTTDISISQLSDDGSITYEMYFEGMRDVNYINVEEDSSGNIILTAKEGKDGKIQNELIHMTDGTMILDGKEVLIEADNSDYDAKASASTADNVLRAGGYHHTIDKYPLNYKTGAIPSGYTYDNKNWASNRITLQTRLGNIAESVLISTLVGAVFGGVKGLLAGVGAAIASAAVQDAVYMIKNRMIVMTQNYADSTALSLRVKRYAHNKNSNITAMWIYQIEMFPKANYYGTPTYTGCIEDRSPI